MFNQLDKIDKSIFLWINQQSSNPFFDAVLPFMRNASNWIPLYAFVIFLAIYQEQKKVWLWIIFALLTILLTDQISSHLIKPFVQRLRPCADPYFKDLINLRVGHCSGGFSFTSSHATNHFGIAIFFITSLSITLKHFKWFFIVWAATIGFAQVYVGVHYPFDVLGGSILGIALGTILGKLYKQFYNKKFTTT